MSQVSKPAGLTDEQWEVVRVARAGSYSDMSARAVIQKLCSVVLELGEAQDARPHMKPCPFCGATGEDLYNPGDSWKPQIICSVCWAKGAAGETEADAIAAWNQRAEEAAE